MLSQDLLLYFTKYLQLKWHCILSGKIRRGRNNKKKCKAYYIFKTAFRCCKHFSILINQRSCVFGPRNPCNWFSDSIIAAEFSFGAFKLSATSLWLRKHSTQRRNTISCPELIACPTLWFVSPKLRR